MATDFSTLYDDVMPEVAGASVPIVLHALRRAAREFCAYSKVDRPTLAPFNTVAGTAGYALPAPVDTEIVEVLKVVLDIGTDQERKLTPILVEQLCDDGHTGRPCEYAVDQDMVLILVPTPNAACAVTVTVAISPLMTATAITDQLASDWGDAIAMGAKYRLMDMSKKLWSDPAKAQRYRADFEAEKDMARLSGVRGKSRAPFRTVPATIMGR